MEIDLLNKYPKTKRNLDKRNSEKTPEVREIARRFGKEFLMETENMVMEDLIITQNIGRMLFWTLKNIGILKKVIKY